MYAILLPDPSIYFRAPSDVQLTRAPSSFRVRTPSFASVLRSRFGQYSSSLPVRPRCRTAPQRKVDEAGRDCSSEIPPMTCQHLRETPEFGCVNPVQPPPDPRPDLEIELELLPCTVRARYGEVLPASSVLPPSLVTRSGRASQQSGVPVRATSIGVAASAVQCL